MASGRSKRIGGLKGTYEIANLRGSRQRLKTTDLELLYKTVLAKAERQIRLAIVAVQLQASGPTEQCSFK